MLNIQTRAWPEPAAATLRAAGHPPLLARLWAARGIASEQDMPRSLAELLPYPQLLGCEEAAHRLADAISQGERLLIVGDYDADGATACAVGVRGLGALGARVEYMVPNRFEFGYGLSPEIVRLAAERKPDLIITVDNGIAAHAGVEEARNMGIPVLITDHHLPGPTVPEALIVNPNQAGCPFPSKHLAGVGVMFYILMALRAELRRRGAFRSKAEPNLAELLDLVALGTVADVVPLDANNRLLVAQGLARIRRGLAQPGILALYGVAGRDPGKATTGDLGFVLGPRLNAAGRIADMGLGIECLLAGHQTAAQGLARELDRLNRDRRGIEQGMQMEALAQLDQWPVDDGYSLCLHDPGWHQGVVGLLASRLKERHHRPVFAFASAGDGMLKASGRSIPALHLRDALDRVDRLAPGLLRQFGGHAAAAGLTLEEVRLEEFRQAFEAVCRELLTPHDLARVLLTDGALAREDFNLASAEAIHQQVWGQAFPAPAFHGRFRVQSQRLVGEKHLKLRLAASEGNADAMLFNHDEPMPERIRAVYRPDVNEWNGQRSLQLTLEHWEPDDA